MDYDSLNNMKAKRAELKKQVADIFANAGDRFLSDEEIKEVDALKEKINSWDESIKRAESFLSTDSTETDEPEVSDKKSGYGLKETFTVECIPESEAETIFEYQIWGWEVLSNQRFNEIYTKEFGSEKSIVAKPYNKITFQRDKGAPWYNEICDLHSEFLDTNLAIADLEKEEKLKVRSAVDDITIPNEPKRGWGFLVGFVLMIIFGLIGSVPEGNLMFFYCFALPIGGVMLLVFIVKIATYNSSYANYSAQCYAHRKAIDEHKQTEEYKELQKRISDQQQHLKDIHKRRGELLR